MMSEIKNRSAYKNTSIGWKQLNDIFSGKNNVV